MTAAPLPRQAVDHRNSSPARVPDMAGSSGFCRPPAAGKVQLRCGSCAQRRVGCGGATTHPGRRRLAQKPSMTVLGPLNFAEHGLPQDHQ